MNARLLSGSPGHWSPSHSRHSNRPLYQPLNSQAGGLYAASSRILLLATLAAMIAGLTGCGIGGKDDDDETPPKRSTTQTNQLSKEAGTIQIKPEIQRRIQIQSEPLEAGEQPRELTGYGRVLDPAPLVAMAADLEAAQASLKTSTLEWDRQKTLSGQNNASQRTLQAAEAAAEKDRLLVQSLRDRLALSWGSLFQKETNIASVARALVRQERALVRLDLPAGKWISDSPQSARITPVGVSAQIVPVTFIGPAPAIDPQLQGQGFLFLAFTNTAWLRPETALSGQILLPGEPWRGVRVPESAVVRHEGKTWVYVRQGPETFRRTQVALGHEQGGTWLATEGLEPGRNVVTHGAQTLLSEELKSTIQLSD